MILLNSSPLLDLSVQQYLTAPAIPGDYKLGEKLGEGSFGQVRAARVRSSKEVQAVEIMDIWQLGPAGKLKTF